ncbi:MAG: HEAT repeat domain-containing protein [Candidatus Omnitrophica bacterium]|nr:HEAT repeat domain-containing protein [Candidatus Omnitrophota bacterium]MBU1997199.1 HEAT repeat domain-containing protein [Candidatus Omnitrophota bacterium]
MEKNKINNSLDHKKGIDKQDFPGMSIWNKLHFIAWLSIIPIFLIASFWQRTGSDIYRRFSGDLYSYEVEEINDPKKLARLLITSTEPESRKIVIEKISDQVILAKAASEDESPMVREAAVKKLLNENTLIKIAFNDEGREVRKACVEKILDQSVLAKIAVKDVDADVRSIAVKKLVDKKLLAKIALDDPNKQVREFALVLSGYDFVRGPFYEYLKVYPDLEAKLQLWEEQSDIELKVLIKDLRISSDPVNKYYILEKISAFKESGKGALLALFNALYDNRSLRIIEYYGSRPSQAELDMEFSPYGRGGTSPSSQAEKAIVGIGKSAVESLIVILKDENQGIRGSAVAAIGKIGDSRAIGALVCLKDKGVCSYPEETLNKIDPNWYELDSAKKVVPYYVEQLLEEKDLDRVRRAVYYLGLVKDKRATKPLLQAFYGASERVRVAIVNALSRIGDKSAIEPLWDMCNDSHRIYLCDDAVRVLGKIGDKSLIKPLRKKYQEYHGWVDVRFAISEAIYNLDKEQGFDLLIDFLNSSEKDFSENTAKIFGTNKDLRAVDPLIHLLSDGNAHVVEAAAVALGNIGDDKAVNSLLEIIPKALENENMYEYYTYSLVKTVLKVLGQLKDSRAIGPLEKLQLDKDNYHHNKIKEQIDHTIYHIKNKSI